MGCGIVDVEGPNHLFQLPISGITLQQLTSLAQEMSTLQDTPDPDIWTYIWGSPYFSSSKAYKHLTGHRVAHAAFKWNSTCQNKHKVFFWLLLNDRLSTRGNCWKEEIWCCLLTFVFAAINLWKNLSHISLSTVILHNFAGLPLVSWLDKMMPSPPWRTWNCC